MEKVLELYKYIDGVNDTPFPSSDEHLVVREFRYDAKRMGGAPTISFTAMHRLCLDNLWGKDVYATFNGERYYIKQTPTSSYSNSDTRYKHEVELISERSVLDNIYFYDVVTSTSVDKPVSNSSKFTFFGDVHEYVTRLDYSLKWANVDYTIVVDEGITSEEKQVTFEDQVVTNALQEIYNIYQIPYYFVGKVIHVGEYQDNIDHVFKYGAKNSLLSISKNNANAKIVNRITGVGSQDNIPYYYPNDDEKGVTIPLLNGSTNGVSISNQSRYRKVRLSDKFVFHHSIQTQTPLIDSSVYTLGDLTFDKKEEGKDAQYSVDFYYTFSLKDGENVLFNVSTDDENTVDLRYEIYKTSGNHLGFFKGENTISLTGGESFSYNFIIRWTFLNPNVMFGVEEQLESLISSKLNISAYIIVDEEQTWTLKNIPVNLYSYGLSVDNPVDGDVITIKQESYINPQPFLMPYVYRKQGGNERFYNAENNTYIDENGEYYVFENEYSKNHPSEHIENFDDIKPTIKNITNAEGFRIDRFVDFAYDLYDNDEVDEEGKFIHKWFFAKLNKLDGENGFNLFDHAIDESEMIISMTSGSCGSCSFKVLVNKDNQKNTVQVDENGNLLRDSNGNVRFGSPQDRQNDTENYEVWIALEKDIDTFGVLMPNATNKYRPSAGDTFVILHIDLPKAYIEAAEKRLDEKLIKYMYDNNFEKFNFSIAFSRIFFAENPSILNSLNENSKITIEYNGREYSLYASSISIAMTNEQPLPEIKVELNDNIAVSKNKISQIVDATKKDILSKTTKDVFWGDIKGVPSWIGSEKPRYSYSELSGTAPASRSAESFWVVKKDETGQEYVYSALPVVTQFGFTSFALDENLVVEDIYDGLPIDNKTIYWVTDENGKKVMLKAKGGGSGEGSFGEIATEGEGNAITRVDVVKGDEEKPDKLVFTKEKTFIDKELLEKDYLTKAFIEENYYTKTKSDEIFFKKDDAKGLYVTLDETTQEILGIKTFKNGLNIGTSKIWQSHDDVVYIDANLVVRGGVMMYGINQVDVPTIMAGVAVDGVTISKANGYLEVIGGGGGSIKYPLTWSGYASGSWDGSEEKNIYIPSKVSELSNDSAFITSSALNNYATKDFVTSKGYITASALNGYATEAYVTSRGYITSSALNGYATESYVDTKFSGCITDIVNVKATVGGATIDRYLGITKNGTTSNFQVGYANHAELLKLYDISTLSNSSAWNTTRGLKCSGFSSSATDIPTAAGNNANAMISCMSLWNYGFQIAYLNSLSTGYDSIPHLYFRNFVNGSYKGWYRIVTDGPQVQFQTIDWNNPHIRIRYQNGSWYYIQSLSDGLWLGQSTTNGVRIDSSGNILATGGITMYSDERKKTILNHVQLSLREVADAPLIEHYYNSDAEKTTHVGSIAQYWAGLNDWFCKKDSDGFYTMEVQNAALASAISVARELLKYETKTDKQIRKLKKRISELEEEVELLKKM